MVSRGRSGGADRRAADTQDDPGREETRREIRLDRRAEGLRIEGPGTIGRDLDEVLLPDPGDSDGLVDRRVGLRRSVDPELLLPRHSGVVPSPPERALPHRQHGAEIGGGSRILDDALEPLRQPEGLAHPVDHAGLDLGSRGRGLPEHALGRHGRRQALRDHRGGRGIGGEVGEEAGVLPVRHAPRHDALEVGEDRLHVHRLFRWSCRQHGSDLARRGLRPNGPLIERGQVLGAPPGRPLSPSEVVFSFHRAGCHPSRPSIRPNSFSAFSTSTVRQLFHCCSARSQASGNWPYQLQAGDQEPSGF